MGVGAEEHIGVGACHHSGAMALVVWAYCIH